jgi:1,2-diacylglycerol 3-alpha-glucosyltransferase
MKIGIFTDTYFPQVSGVSTSIRSLKDELQKLGNEVYIFTTTDPNASDFEKDIVRMPSVPFFSFKDRRLVVRGMYFAYQIAKELELDIIHTQTEFGAGILGKMVAAKLKIPVVHTYHTMYEDYLHYVAKGKLIKPSHVEKFIRFYLSNTTGVICPSERVLDMFARYQISMPMRVIPTGIELSRFERPDITQEQIADLRVELGIMPNQPLILSLSRLSFEKNIQAIIAGFPAVLKELPDARLVIVGKGPYEETLREQVKTLALADFVVFTGEVENTEVSIYYKAADYFVSTSTSETQGLTYTEAIAAGTQCVVEGNAYLENLLDDPTLGVTFATDADFASALISYVKANIGVDEQVRDAKLYEISSEYFGLRVFEFYKEMLARYQMVQSEKEEQPKVRSISLGKVKRKMPTFKRTR